MNNIHLESWRGSPVVYGLQPIYDEFINHKAVQTRGIGGLFYGLQLAAALVEAKVPVCLLVNSRAELSRYREYLAEIGFKLGEETKNAAKKSPLPSISGPSERTVFGPYNFAQTVGLWLPAAGEEDAKLLSPFISTEDFDFSTEEYLDLVERIEATRRQYEKLGPVPEALEALNTGFFRYQSLEECRRVIHDQIHHFLVEAEELQRRYTLLLNEHARKSLFLARKTLGQRSRELFELRREVETELGKNARREKKIIAKLLPKLERYARQWSGELPVAENRDKATALLSWFDDEQSALRKGLVTTSRQVRADGLGLSPLTVNPALLDPSALQSVAECLRTLLREINEAGLYQLPVGKGEAATTPRQLSAVRELVRQLRTTKQHLGELEAFYHRRHYWYAQPARLRRLLAPLLDLPGADWRKAFDGWYFERCLEREMVNREGHTPELDLRGVVESLEQRNLAARRSPVGTTGLRTVIRMEDDSPAPARSDEVLIDLSQRSWETGVGFSRYYAWRSLNEREAHHLRIAGFRDAGLLFHQDFAVITPPEWRTTAVEQPPPNSAGKLAFADDDHLNWKSLQEWNGAATEHLNLFIPSSLLPEDEVCLEERWELLLMLGDRVTIFHDWTPNQLTQALISDGLNAHFLAAALIRAAEAAAATPFDEGTLRAIGREVRRRCGIQSVAPHPMAEHLIPPLQKALPDYFFIRHRPWRDTFLPLEVTSPDGRKTILLPDGWLPGKADPFAEAWRQRELRALGFELLSIDALALWRDPERELARLVDALRLPNPSDSTP